LAETKSRGEFELWKGDSGGMLVAEASIEETGPIRPPIAPMVTESSTHCTDLPIVELRVGLAGPELLTGPTGWSSEGWWAGPR
jgi:hypothetical protein